MESFFENFSIMNTLEKKHVEKMRVLMKELGLVVGAGILRSSSSALFPDFSEIINADSKIVSDIREGDRIKMIPPLVESSSDWLAMTKKSWTEREEICVQVQFSSPKEVKPPKFCEKQKTKESPKPKGPTITIV